MTAQPQPQSSVALPRKERIAISSIFLINGIMIANWLTRIPDVKNSLQLSDGTLAIALLASALGALIGQPIMGVAISRYGSQITTTIAALIFSLTMFLPGFASNLFFLSLALFIFGAWNGSLDVAMNAQATKVEGLYGKTIINSFHGLWSLGGLIGAFMGGYAAIYLSLGIHLSIMGVFGLIAMFIATRSLLPDKGHNDGEGFKLSLPPPILIPLGIIAFCNLVAEGAVADWSAIYLREHLGSSPAMGAAAFGAFSLCMAAGRLTGDWITQYIGSFTLMAGGGVFTTLGALLVIGTTEPILVIIGFAIMGLAMACIFPLVLSTASRTPGIAPSIGIAAMASVGYSGFLAGPPIFGLISNFSSLRTALSLLVLFGLLMIVSAFMARKQGTI
jgi:MFS family permease